MSKIRKATRAMLGVFLIATLMMPAGMVERVFADEGTGVKNPDAAVLDDGVVLSKTARAVEGKVNTWDVTLKVESAGTLATSDTVIIIDTSDSMGKNGKIAEAKEAAKTLAEGLLEGNTTNRVALLQYADKAVRRMNFTTDYVAIETKIDAMTTGGGTFTQGAIHSAVELLNASTADVKNMVLLSDGVPTYNYQIDNVELYLVDGGPGNHENEKYTSKDIPQSAFLYNKNKAGDGFTTWGTVWSHVWAEDGVYWYYNSANCAIAEAGYYKDSGSGDIYTVALNSDKYGEEVLEEIATPGKYYAATLEGLTAIFSQIAGRITSAVQSAQVNDVMGEGVRITDDSAVGVAGASELDWTPEFHYDVSTGKYVAETTYRVEATNEILDNVDTEGYAPLNKSATIRYGVGKIGDFATPKAKPLVVNITKILEGQDCEECEFAMELMRADGVVQIYNLKNGETKTIVGGLKVGDYSVRETGTTYNTVNIEDYATSYSQDKFSIGRDWVNIAGPIDVIVTNRYEEIIAEEPEQVATTEPVMTIVDLCLANECGKGAAVKAPETGRLVERNDAKEYSVDVNIVVVICGAMTVLLMSVASCCRRKKIYGVYA